MDTGRERRWQQSNFGKGQTPADWCSRPEETWTWTQGKPRNSHFPLSETRGARFWRWGLETGGLPERLYKNQNWYTDYAGNKGAVVIPGPVTLPQPGWRPQIYSGKAGPAVSGLVCLEQGWELGGAEDEIEIKWDPWVGNWRIPSEETKQHERNRKVRC